MGVLNFVKLHWDRAAAVVATIAGAIALIVGWHGMSKSPFAAAQIPYLLSGGIGGIFLLGLAGLLWLSADLRDEWAKLDRLEGRLERLEALLDRAETRSREYAAVDK